ncbi:MAG: SMP-30/gluconolactonase/LRE family protein [Spirochaetaceae bacterium]|nr:SMP-30/gluconolactonase/LRE family protein [Spirochaetaceae bacterium]
MKATSIYTSLRLGEGPLFIKEINTLLWVDITDCKVYSLQLETKEKKIYSLPDTVGAIVPYKLPIIICCVGDSLCYLNLETSKIEKTVKIFDNPVLRFNDGKCDKYGNLWVGTMSRAYNDKTSYKKGSLYCIKNDEIIKEYTGFSIPNGMGWIDNQFYHVDTIDKCIYRYTVKDECILINKEEYIKLKDEPDGMCIDRENNLWVALWNKGKVIAINNKNIIDEVIVDNIHSSCITFGDTNFNSIFITAAEDDEYKKNGALYMIKSKYKGLPPFSYRTK